MDDIGGDLQQDLGRIGVDCPVRLKHPTRISLGEMREHDGRAQVGARLGWMRTILEVRADFRVLLHH